jgi:hypothetical protein
LFLILENQVRNSAPGGDEGGTVIDKDGKSYPAKKGWNGQGRCQGN